jgi:hypothetical protein
LDYEIISDSTKNKRSHYPCLKLIAEQDVQKSMQKYWLTVFPLPDSEKGSQ